MFRLSLFLLFVWVGTCIGMVSHAKTIAHKKIVGVAHVLDGDSLTIGRYEIRLFGVDAFERRQYCGKFACGKAALALMRTLAQDRVLHCTVKDQDRYGRYVAVCLTRQGQDVGAQLVLRGLGVAYRTYSHDYKDEESMAKTKRAGAWAYHFQSPQNYRNGH